MATLTKLPLLAAAAFISAPAAAQAQASPAQPSAPAAGATCSPEHAAMGHCTMPTAQPVPARTQPVPPAPAACLPEHAAMGHCTLPAVPPEAKPQQMPPPQSTCLPEDAAMGHCTQAATVGVEGTDLPAGSGSAPPVPTDNAADAIYGPSAMAMGRHHLSLHHGGQNFFMAILNIAEVKVKEGRDAYEWDGEAWYGGDINRLVVKSEGEGEFGGGVESAEVQALYSRAVSPYFDLQAGVRYDPAPGPSRVYATVGIEGLAPGFFDVEGALFLSDRGELMGRLEGYYDQRITQTLILQPRAELNFAAQSSEDIGVGAGFTDAEIGIRLRYDIVREFAPYVGVQYEQAFGKTRDFLREEGETTGGWHFLAGIRAWF